MCRSAYAAERDCTACRPSPPRPNNPLPVWVAAVMTVLVALFTVLIVHAAVAVAEIVRTW